MRRPFGVEIPCRQGDRVLWRDRAGFYRRDVDDEHAEIIIVERVYRVRRVEVAAGVIVDKVSTSGPVA